jgi:hypothetical protein
MILPLDLAREQDHFPDENFEMTEAAESSFWGSCRLT